MLDLSFWRRLFSQDIAATLVWPMRMGRWEGERKVLRDESGGTLVKT